MTRPIDETWEADEGEPRLLYAVETGEQGGAFEIAKFSEWRPEDNGHSEARAKLAAKAPEMARRILVLEKALRDVIGTNCCGCSVYAEIAREALGLTDAEFEALKG